MLPLRVCRCRRFRGRAVRVLQPVQDTRIAPAIQILVKAARPDGLQSKWVRLTVTYHRDVSGLTRRRSSVTMLRLKTNWNPART